jgi:hypothetical protein
MNGFMKTEGGLLGKRKGLEGGVTVMEGESGQSTLYEGMKLSG